MLSYVTPEWLEEVAKVYRGNPDNQNKTFKGMNIFLTFRVLAEPKLGIDEDIDFALHLENGAVQDDSVHISRAGAEQKADFILSATPQIWKKVIRKGEGFISAFMTKKIKLVKGNPARIISLAPKSGAVIDCFYQVDTEWPDEMSPQRLEEYRAQVKEFRQRLGV
jgi:putative sterol carrier protein